MRIDFLASNDVAGLGFGIKENHDLTSFELPVDGLHLLLQRMVSVTVVCTFTSDELLDDTGQGLGAELTTWYFDGQDSGFRWTSKAEWRLKSDFLTPGHRSLA
jgi:hypothetical protein